MNRYIVFFTVIILATLILTGCSRGTGNGVLPDADSPGVVDQRDTGSNSMLLGYYDIYFDPGSCTFDVVGNRTVDFTVNIVPLMNNMPSPPNGIWLSNIVLHDDIPGVLGVDIDFGIYHPYPAMDMFKVYDLMGVVIGDGSQILEYSYPLRVAERFTDLWMTNPDGYTRWFNPSDFAKAGFFGYMPGGIQNYAGNAQVNPYKYYAQDLGPEEDVWEFLTGGDNYDSLFQSGDDRTMKLEFVKPPDGIGVKFGYAVVACWEDQGEGPYTPYHRREAIAVSVAVTPDIWFDGTNSGGDLILDFDLFSWENQPDIIKIESSVLADTAEFDASAIGTPLSDQVSSYHVEIGSKELTSAEGHEFWIIAESLEYDYSNGNDNLIFPDGPLAAFFRYPLEVSGEPINELPVITEIYDDIMGQGNGYEPNITGDTSMPVTYTVDYYDPDSDPCYVTWYCTVKDIPINESTDQVGDSGNCPVDWHSPDFGQGEWDLYARVDDGIGYTQSKITVTVSELTSHFNIPLREGYSAVDLAVDHTNGDLLVLYLEDGAVYKYTEAGDYQDGAEFVLTFEPGMDFIDIAPNGNFIVGGQFQSAADKVKIYGPDGTLIKVSGSEMYESHCNDVIAFTGNTYTNMLGNSSFTPQGTYMKWRFYEPPGYSVYIYGNLYRGCNPDSFVYAHVRGAECGNITMNWVYYIEGGGLYEDLEPQPHQWVQCDEFRVQRVWRESEGVLVNDPDVQWGGVQSDGMDGFNDPKDISRDSDNDFYILDILSTREPLIKKYTELGDPIGSFGNIRNIAGTPLRIEGSDYVGPNGNLMFVLHESEPADLLSVFYPAEIPD